MSVISEIKTNKRLSTLFSALLILLLFVGIILFVTGSSNSEYTALLSTPEISAVSNTNEGVHIEWQNVDGAEKYRLFYKNFLGIWVKLVDTDSADYIWSEAKSGRKYTFTVRCLSADEKTYTSGYDPAGVSVTYIAAPKLSSVSNTAEGVEIKWGRVAGAAKYRVFYKTDSSDWIKIADTAFTGFTWENAESGTSYAFTVRCISEDGNSYTSSFDREGESVTYISAPKLVSVIDTENGVRIAWDKVEGAAKYRILYKTGSGDWVRLTDTVLTSYTWKKAERGTQYTFTVCCVSLDSKEYTSGYDTAGKTLVYSPSLNSKASAAAEKYSSCTRYVYGESAMGNLLEAYIINGKGKNDKILFMDFAVHGFEDEYEQDGKVLVALGNSIVEYYSDHPELLGDYQLVVVPCANPDGAMYGKNNYRADSTESEKPFGRCTYEGIDINRDFKYDSFEAVESRALRDLFELYKPSIYINFHGWEDSVIGDPQLVSALKSKLGLTGDKSYRYAPWLGYIIGYVNSTYNAKAALVEFKNSESVDLKVVTNAINFIIFSSI